MPYSSLVLPSGADDLCGHGRQTDAASDQKDDMSKPLTDNKPSVSVFMITYNHEKFIVKSIESVLMQKTDFPVEIVIGEDCSTDGTAAIIQEYERKHPDKIKAKYHRPNLGVLGNLIDTLNRCQGKYIAMLEGDDYWNDPLKLQKQVDILERNPQYGGAAHSVRVVDSKDQERPSWYPVPKTNELNTVLMIWDDYFQTCSFMFRRELVSKLDWSDVTGIVGIDRYLMLSASVFGDIHYVPENWATHVKHPGGVSSAASFQESYIRLVNFGAGFLGAREVARRNGKKFHLFDPKMATTNFALFLALIREKKPVKALTFLLRAVGYALHAPCQFVSQRLLRSYRRSTPGQG